MDRAEDIYEQQATDLDIRMAQSGMTGNAGRNQLYRQRMREALARGRAGAAGDAERVRNRLLSRLATSRNQLVDRIRGGAAAPGTETMMANQSAILQEAAGNVPMQSLATVVNQTSNAAAIDADARGRGRRGLRSMDFMDRRY